MKRTPRDTSKRADPKIRIADPKPLTAVRGGRRRETGAERPAAPTPGEEEQHNETLVRLQARASACRKDDDEADTA